MYFAQKRSDVGCLYQINTFSKLCSTEQICHLASTKWKRLLVFWHLVLIRSIILLEQLYLINLALIFSTVSSFRYFVMAKKTAAFVRVLPTAAVLAVFVAGVPSSLTSCSYGAISKLYVCFEAIFVQVKVKGQTWNKLTIQFIHNLYVRQKVRWQLQLQKFTYRINSWVWLFML